MVLNRRKVNHNPFEDLNNSNVQYWLGFLAADGAIFEGRVTLGLQEKDEKHIDKFITFISDNLTKRKVIKDNKYILYTTSFRSRSVVEFLYDLGITSNKSKTLNYKHFTNDFLRGVIDGDGYIRKNHREVSIITASEVFAKQIQCFIIENYKINSTIYTKRDKYFTVGVYGRRQVEMFLNELYNNADTYLERKYLNAMLYRNI